MKVLLFGKDGQLGWELQRSLAPLGEVIALGRASRNPSGDLFDPSGVARAILSIQPDVVVNAAAYTAVDKAESEPEMAHAVNALAPGAMAAAAEELGCWMLHYSSDYVFSGVGNRPWTEGDTSGPINVYGKSKLEGDMNVARLCSRHLILRSSWIHSARGGNFARTMLRLAAQKDTFNVVVDQVGAPTGADLLADVSLLALREAMRNPELAGIYNVAAAGETSWHGYALLVLEAARMAGASFKAERDAVLAVPSSAFLTAAMRPLNSRLDTSKFEAAFGLKMPPWEAGVKRLIAEILEPSK